MLPSGRGVESRVSVVAGGASPVYPFCSTTSRVFKSMFENMGFLGCTPSWPAGCCRFMLSPETLTSGAVSSLCVAHQPFETNKERDPGDSVTRLRMCLDCPCEQELSGSS